ncbi:MAG: hypothetical protein AAGK04_10235 [Planctomycetota bacterium]
MPPKEDAILTLAASGAELAVRRGGSWSRVACLPGVAGDSRHAWLQSLAALGVPLGVAVREHGLEGSKISIVYDSPSQHVDLVCEGEKGQIDVPAAEVSARETFEDDADLAVTASLPLPSSRNPSAAIIAADHESVTEALRDLVFDASLAPRVILPAGVIPLIEAVESATRDERPRATAVLGDTASFLVIAERGRIGFSRRLSLSLATMDHALAGLTAGASGHTRESLEAARTLLFSVGVDRDRDVPAHADFSSKEVLASLLPGVQRLQLELRQSIRFGVTESQREGLVFELRGQAARAPGLVDMIEHGLELSTIPHDGHEGRVTHAGDEASVVAGNAIDRRPSLRRLTLVSPSEVAERQEATTIRCLIIGGVAAALALGMQWMSVQEKARALEDQLHSSETAGAANESMQLVGGVLATRAAAVAGARSLIETHAPGSPSAGALITHIALAAPQDILIRSFDVRRSRDTFVGTISGEASAESMGESGELSAFETALTHSELLSEVRLRNVSQLDARSVRFEIGFTAEPGPGCFGFDHPLTLGDAP